MSSKNSNSSSNSEFGERPLCIICWEMFDSVDNIKAGSCGHVFHSNCLEKWWTSSRSCPVCRKASSTFFKIFLDFEETHRPAASTGADKMTEYENLLYEVDLYRDEVNYLSDRIAKLMSRNSELEELLNLNASFE